MPGAHDRADDTKDGALYRATLRRAEAADNATNPAERRKAIAFLIPITVAAFIADMTREFVFVLAGLACIAAILAGVTEDRIGWAIGLVAAGVAGIALLLAALLMRRWSVAWQWCVSFAVLATICGLLIVAKVWT